MIRFLRATKYFCLFVVLACWLPIPAHAATFNVNSTIDAVDANLGDSVCDDGAGNCTLRAAIQEANQLCGAVAHTINLPAGTYGLTIPGTGEDGAATGDLDILCSMDINGAGATATFINGAFMDRVITVFGLPSVSVGISDVTISGGDTSSMASGHKGGGGILAFSSTVTIRNSRIVNNIATAGGGVFINSGANLVITGSAIIENGATLGQGGGISNAGDATLTDVTISFNSATGANGNGGGIALASGTMTMANVTITGNTTIASGGGIAQVFGAATSTMTNVTISGNNASVGGGIAISAGTSTMSNVTISGNTATSVGGGIDQSNNSPATLENTIVANNTGPGNCVGTFISQGYNLSSDGTCGFTATGDLQNTDPLLGPLQDNGGPTFTHALLAGSPAIDAGDPASTLTTDQRGFGRPVDGDGDSVAVIDIGAFEYGAVAPECIQSGYVPSVTVKPGANDSTIYLRTSSLASGYYIFTTQDAKLIKAAVKSLPGRTYVQIKGDADCTTATSGGAAQQVTVAP